MKKGLLLLISFLSLCGFESLSDEIDKFEVENKTQNAWEVEQSTTEIKAYNKEFDFEMTFYVDNFMPHSPQCLSNKRIKDIKFDFNSSVVNSSFVKFVASNSISPVFNLTLTIRISKNFFSYAFLRNFSSRIPFNLLLIQLTWIIPSSPQTYFL